MIVIAPSSDRRKPRICVHFDRWISVTNFEMDSRYSIVSRPVEVVGQQVAADPAALMTCENPEEQQFRFVGHGAEQRKTDNLIVSVFASEH